MALAESDPDKALAVHLLALNYFDQAHRAIKDTAPAPGEANAFCHRPTMMQDPEVETYSFHARVCLSIAVVGFVILIAGFC
ncbi:hypothetical protein QY049_03550 [Bradyrhizobium sp. WYCCWR 13022]|uniref:hypothetical protein n=1 Tax=unclassified Bradyrhizobium TaxID=2631580 RepID=UPI00263B518D|nr:hypothetical protein [Bradyrhizobium sp. WYCCWR 13022]MDN4982298.1 hypothetical protein [Bradyrhizobium sp. WYCCWR 13022]